MLRVTRASWGWFCVSILTALGYLCLPIFDFNPIGSEIYGAERQRALHQVVPVSEYREVLQQYCISCHDGAVRTAGLALDAMDLEDIGNNSEVWEKVLKKVSTHRMPPPSMPQPDQFVRDSFASWLETELGSAAEANPQVSRVGLHRLNRTEYVNAIRDLLALEIDSNSILIDEVPGETGFDNTAGALSVTPVLVERYLSAARKISRLAVGDPTISPAFDTYRVSKMLNQDGRRGEDLPFGSRGGSAVHHRFPVDGEYVVKIRLQRQVYNHILGLGRPHPLDIRLDGVRIKRFTVGGDAPGSPAPDSFAGQLTGSPDWEKYMHDADEGLEVRFKARAGTRALSVSFAEFTLEPEGVIQPPQYLGGAAATGTEKNQIYYGNPAVDTISIGGPFEVEGPGETPSRQKIFICHPKTGAIEGPCAEQILSTLARRAYRRPVTEQDVQPLLRFYQEGRTRSNFEAGIQLAITRLLVSPDFLVRIERDPGNLIPGTVYKLGDLELASRLSFFLWSSIPDEELLGLAVENRLKDSEVIEQQARRMLEDEKSKALIVNFARQWLNLQKLRSVAPDPDTFPDFDENLREALWEETELFLESQIRSDQSVLDLITADYTFVNERLARHYEIPNVYGDGFRRVMLNSDIARRGLLGHASILTVTSYNNRTSPVSRGKWLLENLLGSPPPDPPPNVTPLEESRMDKPASSMRHRLEKHRENPNCAACHVWLDPYGFSLENFDAVGRWRNINEDGTLIDASTALPEGTRINGVEGLRNFLLSREKEFVHSVTEKLMAYALGRRIEYFDLPTIRKITRQAASQNYRWSALIQGIVRSYPFQMNTASEISPLSPKIVDHLEPRIRRSPK